MFCYYLVLSTLDSPLSTSDQMLKMWIRIHGPKIQISLNPVLLIENSFLHYLEARMKQMPRVLAASSAARSHDTPSDG